MTNMQFSKTDKTFKKFCDRADVKPTQRQASKFRNQKGLAWKAYKGLLLRKF